MDNSARPPKLHVDLISERSSKVSFLLSSLAFVALAVVGDLLSGLLEQVNWQTVFGEGLSNNSISFVFTTIIMGFGVFVLAVVLHSGWWTLLTTVPFFFATLMWAFVAANDLDDLFGDGWLPVLFVSVLNLGAALLGNWYAPRFRDRRTPPTRSQNDSMLEW